MAEELPILKGILKGNFSYHNARKCKMSFHIIALFSPHSLIQSLLTMYGNHHTGLNVIEKEGDKSKCID